MVDAVRRNVPVAHIRFQGQSWDIPLGELDVGAWSDDDAVRTIVKLPTQHLVLYLVPIGEPRSGAD